MPNKDASNELQQQNILALAGIAERIEANRIQPYKKMHFGCVTGNTAHSLDRYLSQPGFTTALEAMDFVVTGVGSEIHYRGDSGFDSDNEWPIARNWDASQILKTLQSRTELKLQDYTAQSPYKISYELRWPPGEGYQYRLYHCLGQAGIEAEVIYSHGSFVDILPLGVHKGAAVKRVSKQLFDCRRPRLVAAGDRMNDQMMLAIADIAILPGNAHNELKQWAAQALPPERLYIARRHVAAGVLEGLLNMRVLR